MADLAEWLDFLDGMGPENHEEFGAAVESRHALEPYLEKEAEEMTTVTAEQIAEALGGLVSPVDKAYATGEFVERLLTSFRRACLHGVEGWAEDDLAFTRPWGFAPSDITVRVSVWQAPRTGWCRSRTASGSPRTSPAPPSISTTTRATCRCGAGSGRS